MASKTQDVMARLRESSARLNQLSDEAAATIKAAEAFLSDECKAGIGCEVDVDELDEKLALGFKRWKGNFRIVVVDKTPTPDPDPLFPLQNFIGARDSSSGTKPWSDCNREIKTKTFTCLPMLLEKIAKTIEQKVSDTESAIAEVSSQIGAIPSKKEGR